MDVDRPAVSGARCNHAVQRDHCFVSRTDVVRPDRWQFERSASRLAVGVAPRPAAVHGKAAIFKQHAGRGRPAIETLPDGSKTSTRTGTAVSTATGDARPSSSYGGVERIVFCPAKVIATDATATSSHVSTATRSGSPDRNTVAGAGSTDTRTGAHVQQHQAGDGGPGTQAQVSGPGFAEPGIAIGARQLP